MSKFSRRAPPHLVIAGAPKCGTTALWTYLRRHPNIFFPSIKEPNYFSGVGLRGISSRQDYLRLFGPAGPNQLCGDASTSYLLYEDAVPQIMRWNSDAKIIVMVRNPLDMVMSYHSHMVYTFQQVRHDLEGVWRTPLRSLPKLAGPQCADLRLLDYRAVCRIGSQVARLKGVVPAEQIHIIVYDDFVAKPDAVYRETLAFLRVGTDVRVSFPIVGGRRRHRSEALGRLLMAPPPTLAKVKASLRQSFPRFARGVGKAIFFLNQKRETSPRMPENLLEDMRAEFGDDIQLLGELLNRDMGHWCGDTR